MRVNSRGSTDVRRVFSGKDAAVYSEDGTLLATVTSFQASLNITNATYSPLGSVQTYKHLTSFELTLTISETIIETNQFIQDVINWLTNGVPTMWTFRCVLYGWQGTTQSFVFRDCCPDSGLDLINASCGELLVRQWQLHCNGQPELQSLLTAGDWR